jgi:hypothetical protein
VLGAFVGGFLAEGMGIDVWWQVLVVQTAVAALLVAIAGIVTRSRSRSRTS